MTRTEIIEMMRGYCTEERMHEWDLAAAKYRIEPEEYDEMFLVGFRLGAEHVFEKHVK